MTRLKITLVLITLVTCLQAQQMTMISNAVVDPYYYNGGYAGFERSLAANFHYRNQWNDIGQGVQSFFVNAHLPLYIIQGGMGINLGTDRSGALRSTYGRLSYNYVLGTSFGVFSFSGQAGLRQTALQGGDIITPDGDYSGGGIDHKDDNLPIDFSTGISPELGLSIFYKRDRIEIGVGISDLIGHEAQLSNADYIYRSKGVWHLIAAYDYDLTNEISLTPYGILLSDGTQWQTQLGLHGSFRNNIYGGLSFRGYSASSTDALIFMAGIRINKHFTLFYAYDYMISRLRAVSKNHTHEFTLSYNLNELIRTGLPPKVIYNPRF